MSDIPIQMADVCTEHQCAFMLDFAVNATDTFGIFHFILSYTLHWTTTERLNWWFHLNSTKGTFLVERQQHSATDVWTSWGKYFRREWNCHPRKTFPLICNRCYPKNPPNSWSPEQRKVSSKVYFVCHNSLVPQVQLCVVTIQTCHTRAKEKLELHNVFLQSKQVFVRRKWVLNFSKCVISSLCCFQWQNLSKQLMVTEWDPQYTWGDKASLHIHLAIHSAVVSTEIRWLKLQMACGESV